jgi:hypothetical protein
MPGTRLAPGPAPAPAVCQPARYVYGLLLGQGLAWLALACVGLVTWLLHFPAGLNLISDGGRVLWTGAELLGIAVAACLGSAEIGMACRLRGGQPRALLAASIGMQGLMLAAALLMAAFVVTVGGSLLELLTLGGLEVAETSGSVRA